MTSFKKPHIILLLIFLSFFVIFIFKSFLVMRDVPFHDFDEAHRAENAKRMKEYGSFFVPLTGSSYDRVDRLKIPFRQNRDFYLYYHLERPPLVYILMIISTSIFGNFEWAYRLPSFLAGMGVIATFIYFSNKEKSQTFAFAVGLLSLITSGDLWLSSQYAQMDTGITLFLFLALLSLIYFCESRKSILIILSGMFLSLSILSKLQPIVIFIFPISFLILIRKIKFNDLLKFCFGLSILIIPWLIYLTIRFGINDVFYIMPGFAISSASIIDIHHKAPFFWYIRWWWEVLRPGWTLFLALFFYDLIRQRLNWKKITLLVYVIGGLLSFSAPANKLWWYVLSLIPAVCYYIFLSTKDYLEQNPLRINNLASAIILASLPVFLKTSNTLTLVYGVCISVITIFILTDKLTIKVNFGHDKKGLFYAGLIISLVMFFLQFPEIIPYHRNTKGVASFYKNLAYPKCLWLGDMPGEAALFYSEAGELPLLNKSTQIYKNCQNNYLITPEKYREGELILRQENIRLYKLK